MFFNPCTISNADKWANFASTNSGPVGGLFSNPRLRLDDIPGRFDGDSGRFDGDSGVFNNNRLF